MGKARWRYAIRQGEREEREEGGGGKREGGMEEGGREEGGDATYEQHVVRQVDAALRRGRVDVVAERKARPN